LLNHVSVHPPISLILIGAEARMVRSGFLSGGSRIARSFLYLCGSLPVFDKRFRGRLYLEGKTSVLARQLPSGHFKAG